MQNPNNNRYDILYVFGGEKAQGAEIVIERLISYNLDRVNTHLILSPGKFANDLLSSGKPYQIKVLSDLKKLNRFTTGKLTYITRALKNYFSVSYSVYKYIKDNNIRTVHANTMVPASYLVPLIVYSRVFLPSVKWYWSDHDLKYFTTLDTFIAKLCVKTYDVTFVVSKAVRRKYPFAADKILVMYNGLDTQQFKADVTKRRRFRNAFKIDDSIIVIGMAANINPDKGQLSLIRAFERVSAIRQNTLLMLAGDFSMQFPAYSDEVKRAITSNNKIILLGFADDITNFYNGCDVIVNNSNNHRSESLGTSIYEAMACEKIVLASDTGGNPEIVTDKVDGFLFKTEDENELEGKINHIIDNYGTLNEVRRNAREKVMHKFNIKKMVQEYNVHLNII